MLEGAGLTPVEEAAYRALVATPSSSAAALRARLDCGPGPLRAALRRLEELGLVSRTPGGTPRYVAAPPDVAIEPLVLAQQLRLERVRAQVATLAESYRSARRGRGAGELVEVVVGEAAIRQRFAQLLRAARGQVNAFVAPPFHADSGGEEDRDVERDQLARGVGYRTVYDHAGFDAQGGLDAMLADVDAGEEVRIIDRLPIKLVLVDDVVGFAPMTDADGDLPPGAVVVHRSGLLTALAALFAQVWERAVPLAVPGPRPAPEATQPAPPAGTGTPAGGTGAVPAGGTGAVSGGGTGGVSGGGTGGSTDRPPDQESRRVLALLRAGFTDAAMARQLGTSTRTVQRRIRDLMAAAGATTRFQLGWRATERGWL